MRKVLGLLLVGMFLVSMGAVPVFRGTYTKAKPSSQLEAYPIVDNSSLPNSSRVRICYLVYTKANITRICFSTYISEVFGEIGINNSSLPISSMVGVYFSFAPRFTPPGFILSSGEAIKLNRSNIKIYENGSSREFQFLHYTVPPVDIVFVLDKKSMQDVLNPWVECVTRIITMKKEVEEFVNSISSLGIDARYALITFNEDHATKRLDFTRNVTELKEAISNLPAPSKIYSEGSEDPKPKDALDAIELALSSLSFRPYSRKVLIVITDAPTHYRGDGTGISNYTIPEVAQDIKNKDIALYVVSPVFDRLNENSDIIRLAIRTYGIQNWVPFSMSFRKWLFRRLREDIIKNPTYELWYKTKPTPLGKRRVRLVIYVNRTLKPRVTEATGIKAVAVEISTTEGYVVGKLKEEKYKLRPTKREVYNILTRIDKWFKNSERALSILDLSCVNLKEAAGFKSGSSMLFIPPDPRTESCLFDRFKEANDNLPALSVSKRDMNVLKNYILSKTGPFSVRSFKFEPVSVGFQQGYRVSDERGDSFYIGLNVTSIIKTVKVIPQNIPIPYHDNKTVTLNMAEIALWKPVSIAEGYVIPKIVFTQDTLSTPFAGEPIVRDVLTKRANLVLSQRFGGKLFTLKPVGGLNDVSAYISLEGDGSIKAKVFGTGYEASAGIDFLANVFPKLSFGLISKYNVEMSVGTPVTGYFKTEVEKSVGVQWKPSAYAKNPANNFPFPPPNLGTAKIFASWILVSGKNLGIPKDWVTAGLTSVYALLSKDERQSTYLFKKVTINHGYNHGFESPVSGGIGLSYSRTISSRNNFYPRGTNKYKYVYTDSSSLNLAAHVNMEVGIPGLSVDIPNVLELGLFADLKGSLGISIPYRGYKIIDPVIKNTHLTFTSKFINSSAEDVNRNGLFDLLTLSFDITTNTSGRYHIISVLLVDGFPATAHGSDVTLLKGTNTVTLNIPGQYIYYTNHTGPFGVGLIIQNKNGSLVYYNFTLGKTKSYDYRKFEHVTPKFSLKYAPIDLDNDGKYDRIQVNITEINNLTGLTLSPILTAPGWIVYLNSTNLTNTNRYTLYIDGMHVRKLMGNFSLVLYVTNMTSGVYLGSYKWNFNLNSSSFESTYPTIKSAVPVTFDCNPAVTFAVRVPKEANLSITTQYEVGGTTYEVSGYFKNVGPGIHNLTLLLDTSGFIMHNTRNATILSATLVSNGLTTDSIIINKEASFFILPRAKIWDITPMVNATAKILNTTLDVASYESSNTTIVVIFSSGNITLTKFIYPEISRDVILKIPVIFDLSDAISNLSKRGTLTVLVYNEKGELLAISQVPVDLSTLLPVSASLTQKGTYITNIITLSYVWTTWFFNYHDEFDDLYKNATSLTVDNETLQEALELHNNATGLIKDAWRTDDLNNIRQKLWKYTSLPVPKFWEIRKAYLLEKQAIQILKNAMKAS
ncbi:vWA domain-containing protein [Thermococcus sp.]|uniref:vWA domain-containing protein n=1 Tax=Thermococcus sp. TaxID=35749 RepID=UPI0025F4A62F|nr:vWA domain-containing protein [Thermococcus sp.]